MKLVLLLIELPVNGEAREYRNLVCSSLLLGSCLSSLVILELGDIIINRNPRWCRGAMNPLRCLKGGDIVRIEIDQIGVLENKIALHKGGNEHGYDNSG